MCARVFVTAQSSRSARGFGGRSQGSFFHGGLSALESTCVCLTSCFSAARIGISVLILWRTLRFRFTNPSSAPTPPPHPRNKITLKRRAGGQRTLGYMLMYILKIKKAQICAQTKTTWTTLRKEKSGAVCAGDLGSDSYLIAVSCSYLMRRLLPDRFRGYKLSFPSMARLRWRGRLSFIHPRFCAESSLKCSLRGIPLLRLRDAPTNGKSGEKERLKSEATDEP